MFYWPTYCMLSCWVQKNKNNFDKSKRLTVRQWAAQITVEVITTLAPIVVVSQQNWLGFIHFLLPRTSIIIYLSIFLFFNNCCEFICYTQKLWHPVVSIIIIILFCLYLLKTTLLCVSIYLFFEISASISDFDLEDARTNIVFDADESNRFSANLQYFMVKHISGN